jgi:hypothetical protein
MRKIFILLIFVQCTAGNLFSQNITGPYYDTPFSSTLTGGNGTAVEPDNSPSLYYDLGGHLFAGQYPINNPFDTGDTGVIYLYRVNNTTIIPADTTEFSDLGYYAFSHLQQGKYILKAMLTRNSKHYKDYFPTYYVSNLTWNSSNFLELVDKSIFEANINLLPTFDTLSGSASIKGFVVQASSEQGLMVMSNAEVILFNDNMNPLTFCFSEKNGSFTFPGLPYGTYYLMAESTGRFPAYLKITLDQNHTAYDSVLLEALTHNPATVEELGDPAAAVISSLFPNPADDNINIVVRTTVPEILNIAIISLNGQKILSGDYMITGTGTINIPIGSLSNGVYFLMAGTPGGQWKEIQKFIKL